VPSFKLPAGWYRATAEDLVRKQLPPVLGPLTPETAWRYLYAGVLWSEPVRNLGRYLHLNDQLRTKAGRELADRGRGFLEEHLLPSPVTDVEPYIDFIGKAYAQERASQGFSPDFERPNVTGAAFEVLLQVLLEDVSGVRPARAPRLHTLRGFELAPAGYHSQPDLALFSPSDFRLLISTKWTMRKDRIGTFLHEAYFYKQRRSDLQVAFAVSEYNLNILTWLASDPLVDRVYHAHLPMLLAVHPPFPGTPAAGAVQKSRLVAAAPDREVQHYRRWSALADRLFDLSQLFRDVQGLQDPAVALDSLDDPADPDEEDAADTDGPLD
jgi:hypothetical protein